MSLDVDATLPRPVPLSAVVSETRVVLGELLGPDVVPELMIVADRVFDRGRHVAGGRRMDEREAAATMLGEPGPLDDDVPNIRVEAGGDGVRLRPIDHAGYGGWELGCGPDRSCAGVVLALAAAIGAARLSGGRVNLEQLNIGPGMDEDPARVVELLRLPGRGDDFEARCAAFLHRFANFEGWPGDD